MAALRTPLFDWHVAHGGRMVDFAGWMLPVQYSGIVAEHQAVRTGAGVFDISHMGRFSISGADALSVIDYSWTNDANGMKDGQVRYGLVCNDSGGVMDDILVYRYSYGWAMVVNASNRLKILDRLQMHAAGKDCQINDRTTVTGMVAVQGPQALEKCAGMFEFDPSQLKYYHSIGTRYKMQNCVVSRTGYTGEDGLEVMIANAKAQELWDDLISRGCVPCGLGARDSLRLEAAMPLYGHELNDETDPFESGVSWAVKPAKGDFAGKAALLQRKDRPTKKRVGLTLDGQRAAREGAPVLAGDREIGIVTSGCPSPTLGKPIAMAFVAPDTAAVGATVNVNIRGQAAAATVTALPFYQRAKK